MSGTSYAQLIRQANARLAMQRRSEPAPQVEPSDDIERYLRTERHHAELARHMAGLLRPSSLRKVEECLF